MIVEDCVERKVLDYGHYTHRRHKYHEWKLISEKKETQDVHGRTYYSGKYIRRFYCKWCRKVVEEKI